MTDSPFHQTQNGVFSIQEERIDRSSGEFRMKDLLVDANPASGYLPVALLCHRLRRIFRLSRNTDNIMARKILIDPPLMRRDESGSYRIETLVNSEPFWIASSLPLQASAEGLVCAFLIPAMAMRRPLAIAAELDHNFAANIDKLQTMATTWWPRLSRITIQPKGLNRTVSSAGDAMFFTGGVDSFFTLKNNYKNIEHLINVTGFDIPLHDGARQRASMALINSIGQQLNKNIIHVSTNLREHSLHKSVSWEITHIGAISAIAHSISPALSTVYVASSDVPPPWGSHPDLDPLWSSDSLTIVNDGWRSSRLDKVRAIVDWDIVHLSVKVCWENRAASLNCGYCEKCVRTQMQFIAAGATATPSSFPAGDLVARVEALPAVAVSLHKQWLDVRAALPNGALAVSVDRLLERSKRSNQQRRSISSLLKSAFGRSR